MSTRFFFCRNCGEWIGNGAETRLHFLKHPTHIFIEAQWIVGIAEPYPVWRRVTGKEFRWGPEQPRSTVNLFMQVYLFLKSNAGIIGLGITFGRLIEDGIRWLSGLNLSNHYRPHK